ncbi:hypothetical protein GCM10009775_19430 [Microbacterium aoyamense]|uniref:DUF4436 domain-containing protein n=1 Tax=Microbacterium aoyamense TaxID=344166 RepID=A0ABP5B041_9MICO|nr:DUF4436 family protein [Microbacterium aoyamense]
MAAGAKLSGRRLVAVIIVAFVLVYGVVVALYAISDRDREGCVDEPAPGHAQIEMIPTAVDASAERTAVTFTIRSFGSAGGEDGLPVEPVTLFVDGADAESTFDFEPGDPPSRVSVRLISSGEIERWPFDRHVADFTLVMIAGEGDRRSDIPVNLCGEAHVPGWTFTEEQVPGDSRVEVDGEPVDRILLTAERSAATIAFGLVILALMIVLTVVGLTVAIRVYRGEKKAEVTLMSWIAAMLFATLPLRGFLPGAPPIGSWVDYLVVLWVVAGLVASLVIYVLAWSRWAPPGEKLQP